MSQPKLQESIQWISDQLRCSDESRAKIIDEACFKFNLSPLDAEFLIRHFSEKVDKLDKK